MQALLIIFCTGCVAIFLIIMPQSILRKLGRMSFANGFRPFAPNWITFYSIVITLLGFWIMFYMERFLLGITIAVFGGLLDRIDGRMAHAMGVYLSAPDKWTYDDNGDIFADVTDRQNNAENKKIGIARSAIGKWWIEFNYQGGTDLGKSFDPFADKIKALAFMLYLVHIGIFNLWIVVAMTVFEVFGTFMRRPFKFMKRWIHGVGATGIGKWKAILQWSAILFCIPFYENWIHADHWASGSDWVPNAVLTISLIFAIASVLSRFKWVRGHQEFNKVIKGLSETTNHD